MVNRLNIKTEIVGKTPKRPGNERDANRPPVPMLKALSTQISY